MDPIQLCGVNKLEALSTYSEFKDGVKGYEYEYKVNIQFWRKIDVARHTLERLLKHY